MNGQDDASESVSAFAERIAHLVYHQDGKRVQAVAEEYREVDPLRHHIALSILGSEHNNLTLAREHALAARSIDPDAAAVLQQLAVVSAMSGELEKAAVHARQAVNRDDSSRSHTILAAILAHLGDLAGAERVYRRLLDIEPNNVTALLGSANLRRRQNDQGGALAAFSKAFAIAPRDPRALKGILQMLGEAGWIIGALAMGSIIQRANEAPNVKVMLDLMSIQARLELPADHPGHLVLEPVSAVASRLVEQSTVVDSNVQIEVARALVDAECHDAARVIVQRLVEGQAVKDATDRAQLFFLQGVMAERAEDPEQALEDYVEAVELDPERWDACCNATTLLLDRGDEEALELAGELLLAVPEDLRYTRPQLVFNEGRVLRAAGRPQDAATRFKAVTDMLGPNGLGAAAAQELAAIQPV